MKALIPVSNYAWQSGSVAKSNRQNATVRLRLLSLGKCRRAVSFNLASPASAALGAVAIAIVAILRVAPVVLPASTSGSAGGIATAAPTVTAWYPDGLPSAINGVKVYRPDDIGPQMPLGRFLVGGWDAGPLGMSCPADLMGASSPPVRPMKASLSSSKGLPSSRLCGIPTMTTPSRSS